MNVVVCLTYWNVHRALPWLLLAFQQKPLVKLITRVTQQAELNCLVQNYGTKSSRFHPLCHLHDKFYQAPSFFSCNIEKLGGAWVRGKLYVAESKKQQRIHDLALLLTKFEYKNLHVSQGIVIAKSTRYIVDIILLCNNPRENQTKLVAQDRFSPQSLLFRQ